MTDVNVVLAEQSGLGKVRLCGCNSIHLSIGPVTVTLSPEAFVQAARMIGNAMLQLNDIIDSVNPDMAMATPHSSLTH